MPSAKRAPIVATLTVLLCAAPIAATADSGSNWWYHSYGVDEAHAAGWTGDDVTIAVLDGGINTSLPALQGARITADPESFCDAENGDPLPVVSDDMSIAGHGSNVTALIVGNGSGPSAVQGIAPDANVLFYGFGTKDGDKCYGKRGLAEAIYKAVDDGANIITTSVGWEFSAASDNAAIAYALAKGVVILAAQPNSTSSFGVFPGALNGVAHTSAYNPDGNIEQDEYIDGAYAAFDDTTVVAPGEKLLIIGDTTSGKWDVAVEGAGTSFATPMIAAMLAVVWQKYPLATSNQILQSMIHNTTLDDHPLMRDTEKGYGYGPVSLTHMLRVDPTQYPDENPLMDKEFGKPTIKEVEQAKVAVAAGSYQKPKIKSSFDGYSDPSKDTDHTTDASGPLFATPIPWIAGAGILALAVGLVVAIRFHRRRKGRVVVDDSLLRADE